MDYNIYFSFGSNMLEERFIERCESATRLNTYGIVKDFKLVFNRKGDYENGGVASIIPSENDIVLGAIFLINDNDLKKLDKIESPDGKSYYRELIKVHTQTNLILECYTYIAYPQGSFKPTKKYLNWIIKGAEQIELPIDYIENLKSIHTVD